MGILTAAKPIILICTRDVSRTAVFYRDVLELTPVSQDSFAAVFTTGGVTLRVSLVPDFVVNGHTVMGFQVEDLAGPVQALRAKGVVLHRPGGLSLDEMGLWTIPGGLGQVAWIADPEGNLLSLTTLR